jgi:hypothetical protein
LNPLKFAENTTAIKNKPRTIFNLYIKIIFCGDKERPLEKLEKYESFFLGKRNYEVRG